jgi:hypothetical protein
MGMFYRSVSEFESSWYETARSLCQSRNTQRARVANLEEETDKLRLQNEQLRQESQESKKQLEQTRQLLQQQQQDNEELRQQPITLPGDLALPNQTYGPKMISLSLNLCNEIGFRPAATALQIVFDWLGIDVRIPSFNSIRIWSCRVGIAQLKLLGKTGDDWIWIANHSNQIGQEKVLQIIGIRVSDLPPLGETLPRDKMVVLATVPGTSWTPDDVRREYDELAKQIGPPRYLLTDGAVQLRDSADVLEIDGKTPVLLRDMKHYAANVFEKLIGNDKRYYKTCSMT